jgi:hypothetical protein
MTSKEKQVELDRHRILLNATLNYLMEHYTGFMVFDESDYAMDHYVQEKNQSEKYYRERRLDRLKAKLNTLTHSLCLNRDVGFRKYLEQETGYTVDLFWDLRSQVNEILQKGEITLLNQINDVEFMISLAEIYPDELLNIKELSIILKRFKDSLPPPVKLLTRAEYQRVLDSDGSLEKLTYINGKRVTDDAYEKLMKAHGLRHKALSPNQLNYAYLYSAGKANCELTYVVIGLSSGSGTIYLTKGDTLPMNIYWEDDHTLVIDTSKDYEVWEQFHKITTRETVINVKYEELGQIK